jgi:hypothetical protein
MAGNWSLASLHLQYTQVKYFDKCSMFLLKVQMLLGNNNVILTYQRKIILPECLYTGFCVVGVRAENKIHSRK